MIVRVLAAGVVALAGCYASHEHVASDAGAALVDAGDGGDCRSGAPCAMAGECTRGEIVCGAGVAECMAMPARVGTLCRPAVSDCDAAEVCDGASTACPADGFLPFGERCMYGFCDGCGTCEFDSCIEGSLCDSGEQCLFATVDCSSCRSVCVTRGPMPFGSRCDDGDACTTDDACTADGECIGAPTPSPLTR